MFSKVPTLIIASIGLIGHINGQALDLSGVSLSSISYGGTGCPQGSFVKIQDRTNATAIAFDPFTIQTGPGIAVTEERKNCQVAFSLKYPASLQFGATSTTYSGAASLDNGVSGALSTLYYFSGSTPQVSTKYALKGPYDAKYNVTINVEDPSVPSQKILWSPCGDAAVPLNINYQIALSSSDDSAYGYIKSDGTFAANFQWRKCVY